MSRRTINVNQLTPNEVFMVRGRLGYSRLASQIAGEDLEEDKKRRSARGWIPIERPYTTATIHDAQVIYADPTHKRPEEIYAEESLYTSRSQNSNGGYAFTGVNKGTRMPYIAQDKGNNVVDQVIPEGELDNGLDVTLVMRVFKAKMNNGVTLDGVIVHDPIRYFGNVDGAGLAAFGITFNRAAEAEAPAAAVEEDNSGVDMPPEEETANPFASQPAQPQPAAQQGAEIPPAQQGGLRYNPVTRGY